MFTSLSSQTSSLPLLSSTHNKSHHHDNLSFTTRRTSTVRCAAATAHSAPSSSMPSLKAHKPTTLYEVLRVDQRASATEIKNAYRALAKLYHPDVVRKHPEADGREFIEIHNAYVTLSDPVSRELYDVSLERRRVIRRRSSGYGVGNTVARRWETDQCW